MTNWQDLQMMSKRNKGMLPLLQLMLLMILVCLASMVDCSSNDEVGNLVSNGDFDQQLFLLNKANPFKQISKPKYRWTRWSKPNLAIPDWVVVNRSVQVVSSQYFNPAPGHAFNGNFCVHLNTQNDSAGTIRSTPLLKQNRGIRYFISLTIASNPIGGDLYKAMEVRLRIRRIWFMVWFYTVRKFPKFVSDPYQDPAHVLWVTKVITYVSTGKQTSIEIASKNGGPYGVLVDNVHVGIYNILDNGSFERFAVNYSTQGFNSWSSEILVSPSWTIKGWYVEFGNIKYLRGRLEPARDGSPSAIDLTGNTPAILAHKLSTIPKTKYLIIFDHAANPDSAKIVRGWFSCRLYSGNSVKTLFLKKSVWVTSKDRSRYKVGWKTSEVVFKARSYITYIKFHSSIKGAYGPLLDNVQIMKLEDPQVDASPPMGNIDFKLQLAASFLWVLVLLINC